MKLIIDTTEKTLTHETEDQSRQLGLYTKEAFELISQQWLKVGWNQKYSYTFSWFGRPIIQLPEDLLRVQEVIYSLKPDVIIETGIAHGGSLVYYAGLCKALEHGRVVGIELEIRPANRLAIENHELSPYITLIEGDSIEASTIQQVAAQIKAGETALVILDSCHTKAHVLAELEAYAGFVTSGSYLVATDGIMRDLHDTPRGQTDWKWDNPVAAVVEFSARHPEFNLEQPPRPFNESELTAAISHWPLAWLRRK